MEDSLITSDPQVVLGKPVIRGTRITVELILNKLAAGRSIDEILQDYPHLTREGIVAAIEFAAEALQFVQIHPISPNQATA